MFEPLQQFIDKTANRYGISKEMKAAKVCYLFRSLTPALFKGREVAEEDISPAHYQSNTLTINVSSPGWAQEVIIRKEKIIKEMNAKAGEEVVKYLRTQLR